VFSVSVFRTQKPEPPRRVRQVRGTVSNGCYNLGGYTSDATPFAAQFGRARTPRRGPRLGAGRRRAWRRWTTGGSCPTASPTAPRSAPRGGWWGRRSRAPPRARPSSPWCILFLPQQPNSGFRSIAFPIQPPCDSYSRGALRLRQVTRAGRAPSTRHLPRTCRAPSTRPTPSTAAGRAGLARAHVQPACACACTAHCTDYPPGRRWAVSSRARGWQGEQRGVGGKLFHTGLMDTAIEQVIRGTRRSYSIYHSVEVLTEPSSRTRSFTSSSRCTDDRMGSDGLRVGQHEASPV
jgi:hypothetical protein